MISRKSSPIYLFYLSEEDAIEQIETLLSLPVSSTAVIGSLLEETTDADRPLIRSYDPRAFVVPADEIDMVDVRCKRPTRILVLPTMKCATECLYCYADTDGMKGKKPFKLEVFKRLKSQTRCRPPHREVSLISIRRFFR
jgi:hypothetical protein